jgi:site-specific DNA-methyltransferase (adenine-specific)
MKIHCKYDALLDPKKIKNYSKNRNKHPQSQIERLSRMYDHHGIRHPIIVDSKRKVIAAGHGRKLAAIRAGIKEFPVVYQEFETEDDLYTFAVSDNALSLESEIDMAGINQDLPELGPFDPDKLGLPNFSVEALEKYEDKDADEVPDDVEPLAKLGQIYQLGEHRLMCGSSTDQNQVETLINNEKIDFVHTDPPYGINEKGERGNRFGKDSIMEKGVNYKSFIDDSIQYAIDAFNICENLKIKTQVWWGANYYCHTLPQQNNWLVWDKRVEDKQSDMNSDAELAWVKSKANSVRIFRHLWKGLIKASERQEKRVHPTQKPVALAEYCFEKYDKDSKTVLDLFGGSGSTLIACEKTNRKCFMMELDPHYVDVIIARWEKLTGKKAKLI